MLHVRTNLNFYKLTEIVIDKTHMGTWSSRLLLLYIFQIGQNAFSGGDNLLITGHTNTQKIVMALPPFLLAPASHFMDLFKRLRT